jgi:hypothetical protein
MDVASIAAKLPRCKRQNRPPTHRVVLRRENGRFVKEYPAWSRYSAKRMADWLEKHYDNKYYAEVDTHWPPNARY